MPQYNSDRYGRPLKRGDLVMIVSAAAWRGRICRLDHWDCCRERWVLHIENCCDTVRAYAPDSLEKVETARPVRPVARVDHLYGVEDLSGQMANIRIARNMPLIQQPVALRRTSVDVEYVRHSHRTSVDVHHAGYSHRTNVDTDYERVSYRARDDARDSYY